MLRHASAVTQLPLDPTGERALEDVLKALFELDQRVGEPAGEDERLTDWAPARPGDEPQVGDLYRRAWRGEPDALPALVRHALRLPDGDPTPAAAATTQAVVQRYRGSLMKLLGRGEQFIRTARRPPLADLAFQEILRLHEQIALIRTTVDGRERPLIEPDALLQQKLGLLTAYLGDRALDDPACLATARVHLAICLGRRDAWSSLQWEALTALAHRSAARVLQPSQYVTAALRDAGADEHEVNRRLQPYAERSDWVGLVEEAQQLLDNVGVEESPFLRISGLTGFTDIDSSHAWDLAGYGATAGFLKRERYAAVVTNAGARGNHARHALEVDPSRRMVFEYAQRRSDGRWLVRTYSPVREPLLDAARRLGPNAILDGCKRTSFAEVDPGAPPSELWTYLESLPFLASMAPAPKPAAARPAASARARRAAPPPSPPPAPVGRMVEVVGISSTGRTASVAVAQGYVDAVTDLLDDADLQFTRREPASPSTTQRAVILLPTASLEPVAELLQRAGFEFRNDRGAAGES